jgi:hypothetical protein
MKNRGRVVNVYLVEPLLSTSWATFAVASGGGSGGVGGEGNGGMAPRLVVAFTFVLLGAEYFDLARDAFGFVATTGTSAVATATPACGTRCVPARRRFTTLVDETMVATSAGLAGVAGVVGVAAEAPATAGEGGGACELATVAGWVDSTIMAASSDDGGAEDGEGAQIGGGGSDSWEEVKLPSRAN